MSKLQILGLMLPLLASVAGRPSETPDYLDNGNYTDYADYFPNPTENPPCPAVAPLASFEPSLLDGEWEIPQPRTCQKVTFTRLADNKVELERTNAGVMTLEMQTPGVLQIDIPGQTSSGSMGTLTVIQGEADKYLIFYACTAPEPRPGSRAIVTLVRPSANLQDVSNLMDEQLSRPDISGDAAFTSVLHPEPSTCGASD